MLKISDYTNMPDDVVAKAKEAADGISSGSIQIFAGPLRDNNGKEILPAGQTLDDGALWGMNYYLEGVNGNLPG